MVRRQQEIAISEIPLGHYWYPIPPTYKIKRWIFLTYKMYIHNHTLCQFKRVGKPTRSRNPTLPFVGFFYQRCHLWTGLSLNTSNFFTTNRCTNKMYLSAERISKFINYTPLQYHNHHLHHHLEKFFLLLFFQLLLYLYDLDNL